MDWCHFRFRSVWDLPVPAASAYAVLERAEEYPRWWRQVRDVTPLDDRTVIARFRSVLPYDLVVTARERRREPETGILEIGMSGDLDGWARWTVRATPHGAGTCALYEQEVDVTKPLMRRLAMPGRSAFLLNHALMMRSGRRGLLTHLEAV
ncbi:SRPBCC family protein [Streptomyces odontomachi]|uniref:SRPBCC family protein n=1 Tax=Streptomyces odontomachi TaxID=2944940 RepID=UPI00210953C2|nr:SRPBCC family protein [Streptomyces sp. ODS25]